MATSFVGFHGFGFWVHDSDLEVWLHFLVQQIDEMETIPEWMRRLREHWDIQAHSGFTGLIRTRLDEFAATPEQRDRVIALSEATLDALRRRESTFSREDLNALGTGSPNSYYTGDRSTDDFVKVGEYFLRLLRGELTTTEGSTPI